MTAPAALATRSFNDAVLPAAGEFALDAAHTTIGFVARHLMVTKVRGHFADFSGKITLAENPAESTAEAVIQAASITTGNAQRDAHLTSGDFLALDEFPTLAFRSTAISPAAAGTFSVVGELTIKGVTREVTLAVEVDGVTVDPFQGLERLAFSAKTEIDREDFGITWNVPLEGGGVLVSRRIVIEIEAQASRVA